MNILIVEDHQPYAKYVQEITRQDGHNSIIASNGNEALKLSETILFDLAIIDIFMPGMDGIETLRSLKKNRPQTRIIVMTGMPRWSEHYLSVAKMLGADAVLSKPFQGNEFREAIERAFQNA